jgi:uncharacterized protein
MGAAATPRTPDGPLAAALSRAHGILPDQGPIGVFVHHNTLHAFQHLAFHDGVQQGARAVGARPYLSEDEFRAAYHAGRITGADVDAIVAESLGARGAEPVAWSLTRHSLWRTLLVEPLLLGDAPGFAYTVREGTADVCADAARWEACVARIARSGGLGLVEPRPVPGRHRDVLVARDVRDPDLVVHAELIRLCSGFLDQGQARETMPGRERGFLHAVAALYDAGAKPPRGAEGIVADFRRVAREGLDPEALVDVTLDALGVPPDEREEYLLAVLAALPGWAGMISRLEHHAEEGPPDTPCRLADFLAVRLVHERRVVEQRCVAAGLPVPWHALRREMPAARARDPLLDARVLWGIARAADAGATAVAALGDDALATLGAEVAAFPDLERRRVWMEAYERKYRRQVLDALAARRNARTRPPPARREAQFVFCIDEREESMRRAVEEQGAQYETFGVAGFFGVAIDYQGLYDHAPAAHCPVVVVPAHEVHEAPASDEHRWAEVRRRLRDAWHAVESGLARGSRTLTGGAAVSFALGPLAGAAVAGRVIAPRGSLALRDRITARFAPRPRTRLSALREEWERHPSVRGKPVGFSLDESVERVAGVLRSIGMVRDFAPLVILLGHGSTSLNNPHESAHDCGACGGRRGGANARLFAEIANRPEVRAGVEARGIAIPDDTVFIGGLHDTADDSVQLYDLGAIPPSHHGRFEAVCVVLERARRENARERTRRFDDAPLGLSPEAALAHVEARAAHLAQPRPEYGHCTNAIALVGRRALTRGLHLDRRPFLISYDPAIDRGAEILERILAAVGPVGAGISLEYYFSAVDNERFGCGTKLPHNVTGLIGVMNGHQGDLRTGLPLQMVELHEPMRLLLIVEASCEDLLAVAGRQPGVAELVVNEWVQLVSVHPATGAMHVFRTGRFVPYAPAPLMLPEVERSVDWHGGSRAFLPPALVRAGLGLDA